MIEFTLSRDDEGQLIQTNQMKNALWTLEDNVERSQTDGPNVAVECGLRLAFDESNIVLWWLRLPLRNHDMPWLKYSPNRHILRLESNGRKCKTKKILFQIFYSLLLYKWNLKNGKCFVTLFVSAVGGAGGWNSWLGMVWAAHSRYNCC